MVWIYEIVYKFTAHIYDIKNSNIEIQFSTLACCFDGSPQCELKILQNKCSYTIYFPYNFCELDDIFQTLTNRFGSNFWF